MKKISIIQFLLFHLVLIVAIISAINAGILYYFGSQDIEAQLGRDLVRANFIFQTVLVGAIEKKQNLNDIDKLLDKVSAQTTAFFEQNPQLDYISPTFKNNEALHYQAWDSKGNLIIKSANTPEAPLSNGKPGLSKTFLKNKVWNVFTTHDEKTDTTVMVAVANTYEQNLKYYFLKNNIYLFLVTLPLLTFLIWAVLRYGLGNLKKVTYEIANRDPNYLEPVDIKTVPTEIQPLVDELNKLFNLLRVAFEHDKRFTADAAHELKTPLAALKTQAQVAMKASDPQKREAALRQLISGVDRTTHIIQQLLTLSRLKPDISLDRHFDADIAKIVKEIMLDLAPVAVSQDIDLDFIIHEESIYLLGNAASLSILARNLIDNAIRYTPNGGKVSVELQKQNKQVIFRVTDTGPGIPDNLKQRVFERFFRVLGTKKPGSGLGLAIVKQIAELHDAKINLFNSENGKGLIVEVVFPV